MSEEPSGDGECTFCYKPGKLRVKAMEQPDVGEDTHICDLCWKLLKNPATAIPLMRGHLTLTGRGKIPEAQLKFQVDQFVEKILPWKKRN